MSESESRLVSGRGRHWSRPEKSERMNGVNNIKFMVETGTRPQPTLSLGITKIVKGEL